METYPQDVLPPALELSYPWALSSLNKKKKVYKLNYYFMIGVESLLGVHPKGLSTEKGVQKEKCVSHRRRSGSTCPPAGWCESRTGRDR